MADLTGNLAMIRTAVLGAAVREALASGIEVINAETENTTASQLVLEGQQATANSNEAIRVTNETTRVAVEGVRVTEFDGIKTDYNTYKNVMIDASPVANLQNQINNNDTALANNAQQLAQSMNISYIDNILQKLNRKDTLKGVCFGDSLTYGALANADVVTQVANPYPLLLQNYLQDIYSYTGITISNNGYPGYRSDQLLAVVDSEILNQNPDFIVFMGGTNDMLQAIPVETLIANLEAILNKLTAGKVEVVVMTIPDTYDVRFKDTIFAYNSAIKSIARRYKLTLLDLNKHINYLISNNVYAPSVLFPDMVHLEQNSYHYISDVLIAEVFWKDTIIYDEDILIPAVASRYIKTDCSMIGTNIEQTFIQNYTMRAGNTPNPLTGTNIILLVYVKNKDIQLYCLGTVNTNGCKLIQYKVNDQISNLSFYNANTIIDYKQYISYGLNVGLNKISIMNVGTPQTGNDAYFNAFGLEELTQWVRLAPINSWLENLAPYDPLNVMREKNKVMLKGIIFGGVKTVGTVLFNLPIQFRPNTVKIIRATIEANATVSIAQLIVNPNGDVAVQNLQGNSWLSFEGVSFYL